MMFKVLSEPEPDFLSEIFSLSRQDHNYNLHNSTSLPTPKTNFAKHSIAFNRAELRRLAIYCCKEKRFFGNFEEYINN